jgi:DNA-binding CsgD family transcriptional regulator
MTAAAHGLFRHTFLPVARAWATAAAGDLAAAADILDAAVSYAVTSTRTFAVLMLHDLARLGGADRAARWIRQLDPPDGAMLRVRLAYIDALARGDADELEEQARAFATMGADLLAAEAWAEASALLAGTNGRRSTAASHRASALLRRCEGARTPSLAHLVPTEDLSEREREVAVLAGAGLSSQQIADQLFVSVKTVSNHLQHAYDKLGASGRVELAELLEL